MWSAASGVRAAEQKQPALERFHLHGRVLLPDGRPAAGATVLLKTQSYYEGKAWSLQEKRATDATGNYDFGAQDVPRDSQGRGVATYLYVLADGFGLTGTCLYFGEDPGFRNPFAFVVTGEDVTHDISVSAEATCSGTVVGPDGKPLVGATVRLDGIRPADGAGLLYVLPGIIGTETDAAGRFSLSGLPAGARWRCMVEKEGHVRVAADLAESEKNRVALSLAGTVEGVVVYGDTGRPAANVRLRVQCELAEPPGEGVSFHDIPSATSDDDGRFRITPLPGGQGALQLAVPSGLKDWTAEAVVGLAIQPGKTTSGVVLTLIHGGVLSGRVLDARTGSPVSGATVWVTRTDGRRWPTYENPMTDAQGRYSIRLPANEYQVQFSYAKGYVGAGVMRGTERCAVTVRDGQETQAPDLKAEPGSDVSVKVLMPDGKPAVGIDVMLEGRGNHSPYPERTSPAGEVLFLAQPPGQTMQVRARNGDATLVGTVTITPKLGEANEAVVTLERIEPCSVVGRIVDEAGKPVAGAKVFCRCLSESGQRTVGSGGVSGADGRFEVKGLEAEARLFLDFQAGGYGQATPKPFSLSRGETHDAGTIVLLTTDQEIAGKVVDLDGKPVAHASVKGLALASGHSSYGTTGSDGTFRLKNFPNDTIRINALLEQPPPGSATVPRTAATVRVGTTDVQLVLPFRQASLPEASVSVGRQAPELVLEKGADVTLAQFKGKPVVLAFVSIYSRPCVKVLDELKALQEKQGAVKLAIIAVHDRTATPEEIEQFRKDHRIPFPIVRVPAAPRDGWDGETFRAYGVTALPTVVRIDAEGKVGSVGDGGPLNGSASKLLPVGSSVPKDELAQGILEGVRRHEGLVGGLSVQGETRTYRLEAGWEDVLDAVAKGDTSAFGRRLERICREDTDTEGLGIGRRRIRVRRWDVNRRLSDRGELTAEPPWYQALGAWDGTRATVLQVAERGRGFGEVKADPRAGPLSSAYDSGIGRWYEDTGRKLLSQIMEERGFRVRPGMEEVGGVNCYVAEVQPAEHEFMQRLWLDPSRGYVPVYRDYYNEYTETVSFVVTGYEYQQVAESVWFPARYAAYYNFLPADNAEHYPEVEEYRCLEVKAGVTFTDDHFRVDFPVGTTVFDEVTHTRYVAIPEEPKPAVAAEVGKPAPELVLEQGAGVTLAQFKGKPVVLAFVSIYSRPCVKVLDDLKALQAEKGADTLGVIAVHDRTATPEEIEQFRKDHGIPFPVVRVPDAPRDGWDGETFRAYGVTALPTVVHIDVQGKVASIGDGSSIPKGVPDLLGQ